MTTRTALSLCLCLSSVLAAATLVACGANDPTSTAASSEQGNNPPPVQADAGPPPPAQLCPVQEPGIGTPCSLPAKETCTYGQCSSPQGQIEIACESGKWQVVSVGFCADAGSPRDSGQACSGGGMGNANGECSADLQFFQSAQQSCAAEHQVLTAFSADEKCGAGSSQHATYTCCASLPSGCSGGGMGNGHGLCSADDGFFASAEASCTETHGSVVAFSSDEKCGAGSSNSATYTCCP
jgi:hypothetical protein